MEGFGTGFLTGFMGSTAEHINKRKDTAEEYFQNQMELAQKKALNYNAQNNKKLDAATQVANQMIAVGVPKATVMAIANQNPDDLETFYDTVQKMKMQGVDMSNPEVYDGLIQIDGEFNPGNESVTSLLKRIYQPLTNNAKADPEGWGFDPKGSIWSTMLGYDAMDRARNRLATTEVLPGVSAMDVLNDPGEDGGYSHPLGGTSVTLNASMAGDLTRQAAQDNKPNSGLTIGNRGTIISQFNKLVDEEMLNSTATGVEGPEKEVIAKRRAAARVLDTFPEASDMPEITQYLQLPDGDGPDAETPQEDAAEAIPSQSPSEAATAPSSIASTPTPTTQGSLPQRLPSGAMLIKDNGDGTSQWKRPDGSVKTYDNNDVMKLMSGMAPTMQTKPTSGWLDRLGSEYDN